ncbi:amino acid deaminase/aldolase [Tsuneonella mangrovi]|uniref:amino acid deaminase/aldolase n=1 Tax=Tsuneonella mangrovi TaxID=1982042 RepID=UPI000BA1EDF4|nr:amino acid deaminase/aldolase [Tsuneonella mangrovi]
MSSHTDRKRATLSLYETYANALAPERLPAAFVDLDRVDANIAGLVSRAKGMPIRLVSKSIRCTAMLRYVLANDAFRGLLCFSPSEAAWLANLGFEDIVVAYPSVEPSDLALVAEQVAMGRAITLMVDDTGQLPFIAQAAEAAGTVIPLAIDLDVSSQFPKQYFGVFRSPIKSADAAVALADAIAANPHLRLDGLMGYEGQIAGLMDAVPGNTVRNNLIRAMKKRSIAEVAQRRGAVVDALRAAGHELRFVNGGGTGSFESTGADPSVTELAAGSGIYAPTTFDHFRNFKLEPAAGFALPVVRRPKAGMVTCAGGGYVASGPYGPDRLPQPWLPEGCSLVRDEGSGEVQTPVVLPQGTDLPIGAMVIFRHAKAGELCERFSTLALIRNGQVVDRVPTYRGDSQCFM